VSSSTMKITSILSIAVVIAGVFTVERAEAVCHSCGTPLCFVSQEMLCFPFGGPGSSTACSRGQWDCVN
ncbi:hypothetical protein FBU30_002053, partial [Linnemannia zychae]